MKKLVYPAVLYPWDEGEGYTVEIPDLPVCITEGENLVDAIEMGIDAASGWLLTELADGNKIPASSNIKDIVPDEPNGIKQYLVLDMDSYADKYGGKAVRKTLPFLVGLTHLQKKTALIFQIF